MAELTPPRKTPSSPESGGSSSPWSSFHSALKLSAATSHVPGTPVRQSHLPLLNPSLVTSFDPEKPPQILEEFEEHFNSLDLLIEYKLLYLNCPRGVYILPSSKSLYEWHGVIFVHSGPYKSGIFRFTMYIPDGFPHLRPMIRFRSRIFHPYIHTSNGALNLLRGFPPWDPSSHHLWHVVQYVADCFYEEETWKECESQIIPEAQACVQESLENLNHHGDEEEGNSIKFKHMDEKSFLRALKTIIEGELPLPPESKPTMLSNVTEHVKQLWDRMITR